jgi:predicted transcriptional regulator
MRRSKLEIYLDLLRVLAQCGPLKLTHIMHKANMNCGILKEYLDSLVEQGLVKQRISGREKIVYAITQRGVIVLTKLRELKEVLPMLEEKENATGHRSSFLKT